MPCSWKYCVTAHLYVIRRFTPPADACANSLGMRVHRVSAHRVFQWAIVPSFKSKYDLKLSTDKPEPFIFTTQAVPMLIIFFFIFNARQNPPLHTVIRRKVLSNWWLQRFSSNDVILLVSFWSYKPFSTLVILSTSIQNERITELCRMFNSRAKYRLHHCIFVGHSSLRVMPVAPGSIVSAIHILNEYYIFVCLQRSLRSLLYFFYPWIST